MATSGLYGSSPTGAVVAAPGSETSGLYGSSPTGATVAAPGSETAGLYGSGVTFGGTYFEYFIFIQSETQPATPTGGSWSFTTNVGTPPSGWSNSPPPAPTMNVWASIALVNSANSTALTWSVPGQFAYAAGLPILSGADIPLSSDGVNNQLYIQTGSTPQTIWFKESGTWTRLTGSTLYVDLVNNQTIGGTKTFSSQIQGSVSGTSSNVTGTVAIANGGTGQITANSALNALLPSQATNASKVLTTDGSNTSWQIIAGSGTVTSVNVSGGTTGLTTSGGPVTTSGTITLAGTLAIANGGTGSTSTTYANLASNVYGVLPVNNGGTGVTTSTGSGSVVLNTGPSLSNATVSNYETFTSVSAPTYAEGRLWYDSTQKSLTYNSDISGNSLHVGQETQLKVRNGTGSTIAKGAPVYITSTSSGQTYPNVGLAIANTLTTGNAIGLTNEAIASGADGYVVINGILNGVNTGTFTVGDILYVSPYSAGQLMNTYPPTGYPVRIGVVSYVNSSNGSIYINQSNSFVQASSVVGQVAIANGGTGQSTANAAFNALAPSQTGNSGKYLTTDGTNTSWAVNPLGTVTFVAATVPSFLSISGSPITTSGTLAFGLSGTALPTTSGGTGLTSFTANGVVYASSTSALTTGSALTFDGSKLVNTGYNKSSYQVSVGGIGTFESSGGAYLSYASGANLYSMANGSGTEDILNLRASAHLFYINSVEQMRLTSTGLGIGTSSPARKLQVKGTGALFNNASGAFEMLIGDENYRYFGLYTPSSPDYLAIRTGTTDIIRFDALASNVIVPNGSLGVGTSSPSAILHTKTGGGEGLRIQGTATSAFLRFTDASNTSTGFIGQNTTFDIFNQANTALRFGTNDSERARITSNGNLLLGTTTDFSTTSTSGNLAINGYGIYPYTTNTGATNTTNYSSLNINSALSGTGVTNAFLSGAVLSPQITATATGGASQTGVYGLSALPSIASSSTTARTLLIGVLGNSVRGNSADTSTNASNAIYGGHFIANHAITAGAGINSNQLFGVLGQTVNQNGTVTTQSSVYGSVAIASTTTSLSSTTTTAHLFNGVAFTVGAASGGPGSLTNGYGVYLVGPTVGATGTITNYYALYAGTPSVTGTLTNRYGVWIDDASAKNYFGGSVGIGVTAPPAKLSVNVGGATSVTALNLTNDDNAFGAGTGTAISFGMSNSAAIGSFGRIEVLNQTGGSGSNSYMAFSTRSSDVLAEKMRLDNAGNLGIGTSSPATKLHIKDSTNTTLTIQGDASAGASFINFSADTGNLTKAQISGSKNGASGGNLIFSTSNSGTVTEAARIDPSGNLGLGVTPSAWDTIAYQAIQFPYGGSISGYKGSAAPILNLSSNVYYNSGNKYVISAAATQYSQNQGVHNWYVAPSGTAGNAITFTQAMTLDANGKLGIGTTSPTYKLEVSGTQNNNDIVSTNTTVSSSLRMQMIDAYGAVFTTASYPLMFGTNSTERARIDTSGNLVIGATSATAKLDVYNGQSTQLRVRGTSTRTSSSVLNAYEDDANGGKGSWGSNAYAGTVYSTALTRYQTDISGWGIIGLNNTSTYAVNDALLFSYVNSAGTTTEYARFNDLGNYGLRITPNRWYSNRVALQLGGQVGAISSSNGYEIGLNFYVEETTSSEKRVQTGYSNKIYADGADGDIRFATGGTGSAGSSITWSERMRLTTSGNFGIGTSNPTQKLTVNTAYGANSSFPATSGTTQNGVLRLTPSAVTYGETLDFGMNIGPTYGWIQSTNSTNLATNYALNLNPNGGNVGVNTTSPIAKLDVFKAGSSYVDSVILSNELAYGANQGIAWGASSNISARIKGLDDGAYGTNIIFETRATGPSTTTFERARIDSNGNLLLGTTSIYGSAKLSVSGSVTATSGWSGTNSSAGKLGGVSQSFVCERNGTGTAGTVMAFGNGSSAGKGVRMPFAGKLIVATLTGTGITGTVTVDVYKNATANSSYRLTATATAADIGVTQDFSSSPLSFAAGDTIGWYQTTVPTVSSVYNVNFYVIFD